MRQTRRHARKQTLMESCCEDKASIFVFVLNFVAFATVCAGLIIYFLQYNFGQDRSDEKWIYPFIWSIPSSGFILGTAIYLSSLLKFERCLCFLPVLSVIEIILLLFVSFIFFEANMEASKNMVCNQSAATQDQECIVTKDGHQICGHEGISQLCKQMEWGFYLIFLGAILMAGSQILFITTGCIRRARLYEERHINYFSLS